MSKENEKLTAEQELMVLTFWAHGAVIGRMLSTRQIRSVPGLKEAINAIKKLPDSLGWGDDGLESFSDPEPGKG